jgi:hypothetical protein
MRRHSSALSASDAPFVTSATAARTTGSRRSHAQSQAASQVTAKHSTIASAAAAGSSPVAGYATSQAIG